MKSVIFFAFIIVPVISFAEEVPHVPNLILNQNIEKIKHNKSNVPNTRENMSAPAKAGPNGNEVSDLLKAQTEAIKSLSSKVDSLEIRINKLERRLR